MFGTLVESKAQRQRRRGGAAVSLVLHAAIISAAAYGTVEARPDADAREPAVQVTYVPMPEPAAPRAATPASPVRPADAVVAPPIAKGFRLLVPPIDVPRALPPIDLSQAVTNADDFTGVGRPGGRHDGVPGGVAPDAPVSDAEGTYLLAQVEKAVVAAPGNAAPRYPDMLRSASVEGTVLAQFVVDTAGRADMRTFRVLESAHDLFTNAVRAALPGWRFLPAEVGGRKVRQLVQMPFQFALTR